MNNRYRQRRKILKGNYDLLISHLVAMLDDETKEYIRQGVKRLTGGSK